MDTLRLRVDDGVAWVTLDHPPTNLFDLPLMVELDQLSRDLEADDAVRVVVIDSADPDIWIAHADVELILRIPDNPPDGEELGFFHAMVDRFRTMPKATIALIEGVARGGGCELASSMDMRFGTYGKTVVAQPESLVGILPGGSGTQRWPRLVGRARRRAAGDDHQPRAHGQRACLSSNDLYRRVAADGGGGIRIRTGLAEDAVVDDYAVASGVAYEYLVRSHGANATSTDSAWTG